MKEKQPQEAEKKVNLYNYEIYCENFSSIVISDTLIGAVKEFHKNNPDEHIIFAENILFRNTSLQSVEQEASPFPPIRQPYEDMKQYLLSLQSSVQNKDMEVKTKEEIYFDLKEKNARTGAGADIIALAAMAEYHNQFVQSSVKEYQHIIEKLNQAWNCDKAVLRELQEKLTANEKEKTTIKIKG